MNPPTFEEENKNFIKHMFSGDMETAIVICRECNNIYMTERGPSPEYNSQYCPFCEDKRKNVRTIDLQGEGKSFEEAAANVENEAESDEFKQKIRRVVLEPSKQKFNVAACHNCNNRFIYLEEDAPEILCCAFCGESSSDMTPLLEYKDEEFQSSPEPSGLHNRINRIFYIELSNGINGNFKLTDIDDNMKRYRFVSIEDDRMAFWISDNEIEQMMEFIKIDSDM